MFYKFKGRTDGFLPLGDIAINAHDRSVDREGGLLFSSTKAGVLAHPVRFEYILGDSGSGNSNDILYYLPIPPDGYSALGICFRNDGDPDVNNYWCVRNDYLRDIGKADYWSDKNQNWKNSNGNLYRPVLTQDQLNDSSEEVLIVPTTFFSAEKTSQRANAIVARQLYLPVAKLSTIKPTFDADLGDGASTPFGLDKVAVLPYTAIADKNFSAKPNDSPFYYLACEPFYRCVESVQRKISGVAARNDEFAQFALHSAADERVIDKDLDRSAHALENVCSRLGCLLQQELAQALKIGERLGRIDYLRHFTGVGRFACSPRTLAATYACTSCIAYPTPVSCMAASARAASSTNL